MYYSRIYNCDYAIALDGDFTSCENAETGNGGGGLIEVKLDERCIDLLLEDDLSCAI